MWKFLRKLFGFSDEEEVAAKDTSSPEKIIPETSVVEPEPSEPVESTEPSEPSVAAEAPTFLPGRFHLQREQAGDTYTLGKLYWGEQHLCDTLEQTAAQALPAGSYQVSLRTEGGRHATYKYHYPDWHQGLLWVKGAANYPYALFVIGAKAEGRDGHIWVGKATDSEGGTMMQSEAAYKDLYAFTLKKLSAQSPLSLTIYTPA